MRNQYGYGAFCAGERNHIEAVREALYRIADAIEQHSREKYGEVCDSIIIFKDELNRRGIIHDTDKFANLAMFAGYVFGSKRWEVLGGPVEDNPTKRELVDKEAYAGLNVKIRHKHSNDHHREYFEEKTEMTIFPLIEMVCDWYGVSARYNDGKPDMAKFKKNYEDNKNDFSDCYQLFVIDKVYGFLANGENDIINRICEVCERYNKGDSNWQAVDAVSSHLNWDIKQFLIARKQLYDNTRKTTTDLAARARKSC